MPAGACDEAEAYLTVAGRMPRLFQESGSDPLSRFLDQLHSGFTRLTDKGQGILLAVSGGRDSMAMLHGAAWWNPSSGESAFVVAHLNHGLRGEASRADADLVRSTSECLRLPVIISECAPGDLKASAKGSLEESARNARYEFLQQTAAAHGLRFVATAHHSGDQAETVLYNVLRGTGLRGQSGIPERRPLNNTIMLVRPMLRISAQEIQRFVTEHDIPFSQDETNVDSGFARNRIRNQLLPALRTDFNARVDAALLRLAEQTSEAVECLDALADQILKGALLENSHASCRLDCDILRQSPEPLIRHALTVLWTQNEWPRQRMTSEHWTKIAGIVFRRVCPSIDLPEGIRVTCSGKILRISAQHR